MSKKKRKSLKTKIVHRKETQSYQSLVEKWIREKAGSATVKMSTDK